MTSTEQQVREVLEGYASAHDVAKSMDWLVSQRDQAIGRLLSLIEQREAESYRRGYNDNARDCSCDESPASPHQHLMDDGKSHDIKPQLETLKETN